MITPGSTNPLLATADAGGYQIQRSLRFNSADSAYLNRTPASAGNRKTWTWSGWVKRSGLPAAGVPIFGAQIGAAFQYLCFGGSTLTALTTDALCLFSASGENYSVQSAAVYRDVSAWYHIVCAVDTTQATAANRVRMYVNGSEVSYGTSTYPTQNLDTYMNSANSNLIGLAASVYFQGYMTEVNFIDGSALTPSSFGETDTDTGVWKPKAYSGSYGTNGFYLKFADNSGTTSTTLGKDSSGNGNNWTPNNFSVTAGAGNDSLVDTPNNYGTDTGAGGEVRGNYATWNPIYVIPSNTTSTFTNGNLDFSVSGIEGAGTASAVATMPLPTTGKWYWEITPTTAATGSPGRTMIGIMAQANINYVMADSGAGNFAYTAGGSKVNNGSYLSYGNSYTSNDVIGIAVDLDNGAIYFAKNGTWQNSGVPTSGSSKTGAAYTTLTGSSNYFPAVGYWGTFVANFGQRPFAYTAPSGFKALCTQNLPTPTIGATSATQAGKYFNTVLYTGDGATTGNTQVISTVGFQPDLVWFKSRSNAYSHVLIDAVRGGDKILYSDQTSAQINSGGGITAFSSTGFTVATDTTNGNSLNTSGSSNVAWNWKANGAGSSNTAGSISSTVSANTAAGFSIVTYTGNATAGATIGHGLGATPSMIIVKDRVATSGAREWVVYHSSLGNTKAVFLSTTGAAYTGTNLWNNTSPTSTVFTVGNSSEGTNGSGNAMLAYCFAPIASYSSFGSYVGNGSSDGPFIFTGFRPRYVMIKNTSAAESWLVYDAVRNTYNVTNLRLRPNSFDAEVTVTNSDFLSNGFKLRTNTAGEGNDNGSVYVYAAFAEVPAKFSLAR